MNFRERKMNIEILCVNINIAYIKSINSRIIDDGNNFINCNPFCEEEKISISPNTLRI